MRYLVALCLLLPLAACGDEEKTPEDACANVEAVCDGDPNQERVRRTCEEVVEDANQTVIDCLDAATSCSESADCFLSD